MKIMTLNISNAGNPTSIAIQCVTSKKHNRLSHRVNKCVCNSLHLEAIIFVI